MKRPGRNPRWPRPSFLLTLITCLFLFMGNHCNPQPKPLAATFPASLSRVIYVSKV